MLRKILFISLVVAITLFATEPALALQHYVKDILKGMQKECDKKPNGKDCRQACASLGATADKWDVALNEKNRCIELTCGRDDDKTEKRENYWGNEVEVYTACGILCENIDDRHPLCALEKIEKYCQGKGKDEGKCAKYCERSGHKNRLCPNFSAKKPAVLAKAGVPPKEVKQEKKTEEVSRVEEKITEPKTDDVSAVITATPVSLPTETAETNTSIIEKLKGFWKRMWK